MSGERARELARTIGFLVAGIVFILAGIYMYHILATYPQMGEQARFWVPIAAPFFIIIGIIVSVLAIFYIIVYAGAVLAEGRKRET